MQAMDSVVQGLATDLRAPPDAGAFEALGPVRLKVGPFASAELAARVLLADVDHLSTLARHTGHPAAADRWTLLARELDTLLLMEGARREKTTHRATVPRP